MGTAGLRPLEESGLEIFYSLAPGAWGRGYATEAARAVVEYGLGALGLPEVLAEVDEGNAASVAVVKRLGMTPYAVVPGVLGPMTRYRTTAGCKQHPSWNVDQLPDGTFRWTTPAGRIYTTSPPAIRSEGRVRPASPGDGALERSPAFGVRAGGGGAPGP